MNACSLFTWYSLIGLTSITRTDGWSENHFGSAELMSPSSNVDYVGRGDSHPTVDAIALCGGAE